MKRRGKECESRLARSLENFKKENGGVYWRIEDGAGARRVSQYGDFFYESPVGISYLFECKETERNRFPIRNIRVNQFNNLTEFALLKNCMSYVFILFKSTDQAFMIDIFALCRWMEEHPTMKSLSPFDCEALGISPLFDRENKKYNITPLLAL